MIPVRLSALNPHVEYFLDCAQEAGELDVCSAFTLKLYGSDDLLVPICNETAEGELKPYHWRARQAKCLKLADIADTILPQLDEPRRAGLITAGLKNVSHLIYDMANTMSYWTMEDEIEGGCMEPYRRGRSRLRNGITFKRTDRRLHSPKFIRRYVKVNAPEHCQHISALANLMIRRARVTAGRHDPTLMDDYRRQQNFDRDQYELERYGFNRNGQRIDEATETAIDNVIVRLKPKFKKRVRKNRRMVLRSLKTALNIVGEDTVRAFLRGEEIKLMGTDTILMIRKRGGLGQRGHGCLSVAIADRNGLRLADLCTFIENTPTLDQLTGFALFMSAGDEAGVLRAANVIDATPIGEQHPVIQAKREETRKMYANLLLNQLGPERADQIAQIMSAENKPVPLELTREQRNERAERYWEKTKGEWIEALMVFVIGYRNFVLFKQAGAL